MLRCLWVKFYLVFVSFLFFVGCTDNEKLDPIIHQRCGLCHSVKVALNKHRSRAEWEKVVYAMKVRGLQLSDNEEKKIIEYLSNYYGK